MIVHGDGTSLWTLTHHRDFKGFIGLLGNPHALGAAFHITSDEVLTWNQIHDGRHRLWRTGGYCAYSVRLIAAFDSEWGASLLGG